MQPRAPPHLQWISLCNEKHIAKYNIISRVLYLRGHSLLFWHGLFLHVVTCVSRPRLGVNPEILDLLPSADLNTVEPCSIWWVLDIVLACHICIIKSLAMGITPRTTKIDVKYTLICYAPIYALPHYPPWGSGPRKWSIAPLIWADQVITSPSSYCLC